MVFYFSYRWTTIRKGVTLPEVTAALPTTPRFDAKFNDSPSIASSSLWSSNDKFSATMPYPPPSLSDPKLFRKRAEGTAARAETEQLKKQEDEGRRDEQVLA